MTASLLDWVDAATASPTAPTAPAAAAAATDEAAPLSVSALTLLVKNLLEQQFGKVVVTGEISGLSTPSSGHIYFDLKDNTNVVRAVIWRSAAEKIRVLLTNGAQVVVRGQVTAFRSNYQIIVTKIELAGVGQLMQLLDERKARLAAEGLFDAARKRPLPLLPQRLGIITSPTGAVIEDMLHRLRDRCPRPVALWPVRVQGTGAAAEMVAAIAGFNALPADQRPDLLILARGGGSMEDLWEFNDEALVRAVAASAIPVVTGVGHEPDVTLVDYAADLRAPTPTAAIELAVPVRTDLLAMLASTQRRVHQLAQSALRQQQQRIDYAQRGLPNLADRFTQFRHKIQQLEQGLIFVTKIHFQRRHTALNQLERLLISHAPTAVLKRGYAYVTDAQNAFVTSAQAAQSGPLTLHFADGSRKVSPDA